MTKAMKVDFATFCHAGDAHRLHRPGQLKKQVESNNYTFNKVFVIHQRCSPADYENPTFADCDFNISIPVIMDLEGILREFNISDKAQYKSDIDKAHQWQYHVVNHLAAIQRTQADYIVFADNDCWMVEQPEGKSWIDRGIELLQRHDCFIVSPNDGEPERKTWRMSQQMFMARVKDFRYADFNQPGWDGNVNVPGGPLPEYWAMLEGRMQLYCQMVGKYRYVLGPEYRYWHFNRLTTDGFFETDRNKY